MALIAVCIQNLLEADLEASHDSWVCRILPVRWKYWKLLLFESRKASNRSRYWSLPVPNLKYTLSSLPIDHCPQVTVTTNNGG